MLRHARAIRTGVALGGLVAIVAVLALLPPFGQAAPRWVWRVFVVWCVAVPYWQYAEYRLLLDPGASDADRRDFVYQQSLSRTVWAGFAVVLAVRLLT